MPADIAQAGIVNNPTDRLGADGKTFLSAQAVTDTAHTGGRIFPPVLFDPALQLAPDLLRPWRR
ncbi:MAG: hypothetical protein RBR09_13510 [Desulfobulbaceae bacterium]|jgi:hypothetical protein|nr:hypothetical protein [Desulfobulbaceae bacterium]